jgi:Zn-dependent peptidase ImmA (M78 family)
MIEFKARRKDKSGTPILSDVEIDQFAHAVLEDYRPELLEEPGRIAFEHFLESYLGVSLAFYDIYNEDPDRPIFAATAFQDERLRVFDREKMSVVSIPVAAWTVIIDNSVMQPGKEGLALFTGLHEGGHIMLHSSVYVSGCANQLSLFEDALSPIVSCHRDSIENFGTTRRQRTPVEWREHHADYFAAALAMPNATFKPFVHNLLREHDFWKGKIITGVDEDLDDLARYILPECISEAYGVSKKAAFVKLRKTGFVVDKAVQQQRELQVALY